MDMICYNYIVVYSIYKTAVVVEKTRISLTEATNTVKFHRDKTNLSFELKNIQICRASFVKTPSYELWHINFNAEEHNIMWRYIYTNSECFQISYLQPFLSQGFVISWEQFVSAKYILQYLKWSKPCVFPISDQTR